MVPVGSRDVVLELSGGIDAGIIHEHVEVGTRTSGRGSEFHLDRFRIERVTKFRRRRLVGVVLKRDKIPISPKRLDERATY